MPIQTEGPLFEAVQKREIFADSKFFVDCYPSIDPKIVEKKFDPSLDLPTFIEENFHFPGDIQTHIDQVNAFLLRKHPQEPNSTLIPLPNPHVIPGGRFREAYYWDTYFSLLSESYPVDPMLENFVHLIDTYGFIPNGNRTYYLSRSHPPFFSHMIKLSKTPSKYHKALQKELTYWMSAPRHTNTGLARYYDDADTPRPESYREDVASPHPNHEIRAACASGWDFSSRWMDGDKMITTSLLPVDLNCLIYHMEKTLGRPNRASLIQHMHWSDEKGYYFDFNTKTNALSPHWTLAGVFPLFVKLATKAQAKSVAKHLEQKFLKVGGLITTLNETGEQWDAPNGWAPLQYIAIQGLRHYDFNELADEISRRWIQTNQSVFNRTGAMMEKYNVLDPLAIGQGGEYAPQQGFGWTNGVLKAIQRQLERR